jgi:DNA-binding winged helix-turn-helix (wHTH) protein/tetratricopeptide (TPR) repeat protein
MSTSGSVLYVFGAFCLDTGQHLLTRETESLSLAPKSFELLFLLVRNAGRLTEKERIMQALWPETFVEEANLSNLVAGLRRTLGDSPSHSRYIQTVPKVGYRFVAPVTELLRATSEGKGVNGSHPVAIRVLAFPFRISGAQHELEHLAIGLPDSISNLLSDLNAFTIRSVQLAMRFDPMHWDPARVAEEADVDFILTGSVSREEAHLKILTQLMEARTGALRWSKQWQLPLEEISRLPNGVVQMVVRALLQDEPGSISATSASSSAGFELYIRASQLALKRTPENMALARDLYLACVERDPGYAPAWACLGRCYRFLDKFSPHPGRCLALAREAFERAFALNPDLGLAHTLYSGLQADLGEAEQAMSRLLKRAAAHPNDPELFSALVHVCRYCGQLDASLAAHERALTLDRNAKTSVAHTYFCLGDFERAAYWYGSGAGLYLDALALACQGREREARALLWARQDTMWMMPALMKSLQAYLERDIHECIEILEASAFTLQDPEMVFYAARQAAQAGDLELGNRLLRHAVEHGYYSSYAMTHDSWLQALRATPEFERTLDLAKAKERKSRRALERAAGLEVFALESQRLSTGA